MEKEEMMRVKDWDELSLLKNQGNLMGKLIFPVAYKVNKKK
jgi:hypothetical protein